MTLKQWADKHSFNILWLDRRDFLRFACVDKLPSQWFSPKLMEIPPEVEITDQDWADYSRP